MDRLVVHGLRELGRYDRHLLLARQLHERAVSGDRPQIGDRHLAQLPGHQRAGDPAVLIASADRIRAELGWRPRHPALEQIIGSAWEWHRSHPNGYAS